MGLNISVEHTSTSGVTTMFVKLGVNLVVNLNTSFRVQDFLKRCWKRGIFDFIHRLPIVLCFCWVIFGIKVKIGTFVPLFSTCQTTFVANSFHNIDCECDFQSFSYNYGTPWYPFYQTSMDIMRNFERIKVGVSSGNRKSVFNRVMPPKCTTSAILVETVKKTIDVLLQPKLLKQVSVFLETVQTLETETETGFLSTKTPYI